MKEFYGKIDMYGICYTPCLIKSPIMIGSVACSECNNCSHFGKTENGSVTWIKCKELDRALGNDVDEM